MLVGGFQFESNSPQLLACGFGYLDLPRHRLSSIVPSLRVRLLLSAVNSTHAQDALSRRPVDAFWTGIPGGADGFLELRLCLI